VVAHAKDVAWGWALRTSVALAVSVAVPAFGQDRRPTELQPLRSTNRPLEVVGPLRAGIVPVDVIETSFEDAEDEFAIGRSDTFPSRVGLESLLKRRTPEPVTRWDATTEGDNIDPQVAVSDTVVAVLNWDKLAFYDKAGVLLPATPSFRNPTDTETIFNPVAELLDKKLNLNPAIPDDDRKTFKLANGNGKVGDARVAFDPHRNRFIVVATAKNSRAVGDPHLVISQRRTKFLLAVSITENPADGFMTWGGNGTPDDGACDSDSDAAPCPGTDFVPGDAGDYPTIGISRAHYVITDHVEHEGVFDDSNSSSKTAYIVTVNAADAAAGHQDIHGHAFWFIDDPSTGDVATGVIGPAIQHDKVTPKERNLLMQVKYGTNLLSLYSLSASDPPTLHGASFTLADTVGDPIDAPQPSSLTLNYDHGTHVVTADLRGATLVGTTTDCVHWFDMPAGDCADAIQVLKLFVTTDAAFLLDQAVFGERNRFDDPPDAVNWYANPGVAVNKHGDLVTTYNRTGKSLPPEVRYSAWFHDEDAPRPSAVLRQGTGTEKDQFRDDTAGIAVDPFDDTAIWMSHTYAAGVEKQGLVVGKVFGEVHPDLAVSDFTAARDASLLDVAFTVTNHGDGAAPAAEAKIALVCDTGTQNVRPLDSVPIPALAPGHSDAFQETVTLGVVPLPAVCRVRVRVEPDTPVKEYSKTNNHAFQPLIGQ
jgi:hypothetical protein